MTATNHAQPAGRTRPSPIADALTAPGGAIWHRVALQVNPYGYEGRRAPRHSFDDEAAYNNALVAECRRLGVDLIGITDHWRAESGVGLIEVAEAAGIVALPGFEAVSSEGIHLLILFERSTPLSAVDAAIGGCGVTPGCASGQPGRSFGDIVSCAVDRGAMVIPAHVNGPDGLLTALNSGFARITAWRHPDVHAVAVAPGAGLTELQRRVLNNAEAEYSREHPVAVLHADDISDPQRLGTSGGSCWVKMAAPSLAGLQLAVRTPSTRISLSDPARADHPVIEAVAWEGGFLDGVRLRFSGSLTCLVGGRGTGKSTVVESLRFALGLVPIGEAATKGHRQLIATVLQPGTKVTVQLRSRSETYSVERSVPDPPVVRDSAGSVLSSRPADVLGAVEVFSQHELAELAESQDYVAELLRRFGGPTMPDRHAVGPALRRNREGILAALHELETIDEQLDELPRQQEALTRFHAEGLDSRLAEQAEIDREQSVLATTGSRIDDFVNAVDPLRDPGLLDPTFITAPGFTGAGDIVMRETIAELIERLRTEARAAVAALDAATSVARDELTAVETEWTNRTAAVRDRFDVVLRTLQGTGLDANRYLATRRAVERLSPLVDRRPQVHGRLTTLRDERRQLLAQLAEEAADDRRRVSQACSAAGAKLRDVVRVKPVPSESRDAILKLIENVPGQRTQIKRAVQHQDFSPLALAAAARRGVDALAVEFDIRGAQAASLVAAGEPLFLALEEMTVPTAAVASLNVADGEGQEFRRLSELSQGQKATALLLLLLTSSNGPLIIDQPEDDLDNRFIWEGVVPRLRELKNTRQLIFSTHNANIPVLGDAELVVVLESVDRKGRVAADGAGSLDEEPVRVLAEQILEGGREAFGRRRYLYGF